MEALQEVYKDEIRCLEEREKDDLAVRSSRGFLQQDSQFTWVPSLEEHLGEYTIPSNENSNKGKSRRVRDVLIPGMVLKGTIIGMGSNSISINFTDILYVSTVIPYQCLLSKELHKSKRIRVTSSTTPFCGPLVPLPSTEDYSFLKQFFAQQNGKVDSEDYDPFVGYCLRGDWNGEGSKFSDKGTQVAALITDVHPKERIVVTFKQNFLPSYCHVQLGVLSTSKGSIPTRSFLDMLKEETELSNPYNLPSLSRCTKSELLDTFTNLALSPSYGRLRATQSRIYVQQTYQRGTKCFDEKCYGQAISCFDETLRVERTHINAMLGRGAALAYAEHYDRAIKQLERVLIQDPKNTSAKQFLKMIEDKIAEKTAPPPSVPQRRGTTEDVYNLLKQDVKAKRRKKQKEKSGRKKEKAKPRQPVSNPGTTVLPNIFTIFNKRTRTSESVELPPAKLAKR